MSPLGSSEYRARMLSCLSQSNKLNISKQSNVIPPSSPSKPKRESLLHSSRFLLVVDKERFQEELKTLAALVETENARIQKAVDNLSKFDTITQQPIEED